LTAVISLILLTSLLEVISFSLIVPVTQLFTSNPVENINASFLFKAYENLLVGFAVESRLAILGIALIGMFGLKNGLQYLREVLSTTLWLGVVVETRAKLLVRTLNRPYGYFLNQKQGTLVQRLYNEPYHVATTLQVGIDQLSNILAVVSLLGLLVLVSWKVTALILTFACLYGLTIWRLSKRAHTGGGERLEVEAAAMALLTETVGGIRQVKVFSAESRVQEIYCRYEHRFLDLQKKHWLATILPHRVTEVFWIGVLGLLLCLPAMGLVGEFRIVVPIVAVFSAVAFRIGPYLSRLSQGWLTLRFYWPALWLLDQLLETEDAHPHGGKRPFRTLLQAIRFEDVSFAYGKSSPVLSHISVCFNRGAITAIIGSSGAGKSTLVDLLVRLYEPSSGRITVDGVDLREYEPGSWLAAIGFVSQDTFIFHGTVRDNIAFSQPGASLEDVQSAARQANAHEFIERLPKGYDTIVGDRGLKLSGGERQRIAIARALVRDPQILIFDEATSALDNQSEVLIQEAIARIACDRTVILIAHRLSTVIWADKIVVIGNGTVVEEGTHASLLKKEGGAYAALYAKEST
jgi:subfamily B ATP-binding cassette protein MsbA